MKKDLFNLKMAVVGAVMMLSTAANAATFTAVLSGNWSSSATWGGTAPTALVSGDNIVIGSGITVTLDMDVTFTSNLVLPSTFNVDGVLTSSVNALTVTQGALTGGGMISVKKMAFTNNGTAAFTGTLNAGTMLNSTSSLAFLANASVSDSLILESGVVSLNGASTIMLMTNSTIRVNNGSIALGSGVFNVANNHNVMYVGTSKTSGLELSGTTVQNVWVSMSSNSQSLKLGNDFIVNGNLSFNNGSLDLNGKKLILMGDLSMASTNSFVTNSNSDLTIMGSGTLTSGLMFTSGSTMNDLTINRSSSTVKLMSSLNVAGHLNLISGTTSIESGSSLTMNANSIVHIEGGSLSVNSGNFVGTASYNVEYMGSSNASSGVELTGSGLNNLTVNYGSNSNHATLNNNVTVAGSLNMMNGSLDLNGKNLTLNGTISQGTNNASLIGSSNSDLMLNLTSASTGTLYFDQSNNNLHNLTLGLSSSASSVMVGSAMTINSELHFTKGKLVLGTMGDLMINSTGTITGYDNNNYIVTTGNGATTTGGHLTMSVTSGSGNYLTFPVGTYENYSPAYIQQTSSGTSGNFMVMAANEFLVNGTTGIDESGSQSLVKRTWYIESASGVTVNMNLKLGWTSTSEVNGFDRNNAVLRHYTNSAWDMSSAGSASIGANSTYEISRTGFTSLSPFGVTDNNTSVGIKQIASTSVNMELYPNPAKETILVKSSSTSTCRYEVVDITGRVLFTAVNADAVTKFDVSKLEKGYYFIKVTETATNNTGIKRFVKD